MSMAAKTPAKRTIADPSIKITHIFNVPRQKVFCAWAERTHLVRWWAPPYVKVNVRNLDFRPGGRLIYSALALDEPKIWGKFAFREIDTPNRIVFVYSYIDRKGGIVRHPSQPNWPLEVEHTLTLLEKKGKTVATLLSHPIHANGAENQAFRESRGSVEKCLDDSLQRLGGYLGNRQLAGQLP